MMSTQRQRRSREVAGPTPHSVAIRARPTNKIPPEQLILERRKKEEMREQAVAMTKYQELNDLKNDWEQCTDRKIQLNTVKRRVQTMLQAEKFNVEDRRERLRSLLQQEEEQYLGEMEAKEETTLERQAKMRERAKQLKDKREAERLEIVQQKLDERWRDQCEELRSTYSKRQQDEVAAERMEQLRIKSAMETQRQAEEHMYAQLWEQDMVAKSQREEAEEKAKILRNREVVETLRKQMAALETQKAEEKKLKAEEAQLLEQQRALRQMEEMQALEEKRQRQQEMRNVLNLTLRMKMKKEAKEEQEQLAFDMKMLEQLLEESRNEAMEQEQRKRELCEEYARYNAYLQQMKKEEEEEERQLDKIIDTEVEKQWQKRLAQWRLEREARKQLLDNVLATRQKQVQDKLLQNELSQLEAIKEREALVHAIEENKRVEMEQNEKLRNKHLRYQEDLEGQMGYNRRIQDRRSKEEEQEFLAQQSAEAEYQRRLKDAIERPSRDKMHPMRSATLRRASQMADILG